MIRDRIKGTNAFVVFANHEDLLQKKESLDEMYKKLNSVLDIIRNRLKSGDLSKDSIDAYRIEKSRFLITIVVTENMHNPYIFVQNRLEDKTTSKYFTYEDIVNLTENESLQDLQDKFLDLGKNPADVLLISDNERNVLLAEIKDIEQSWEDSSSLSKTPDNLKEYDNEDFER